MGEPLAARRFEDIVAQGVSLEYEIINLRVYHYPTFDFDLISSQTVPQL